MTFAVKKGPHKYLLRHFKLLLSNDVASSNLSYPRGVDQKDVVDVESFPNLKINTDIKLTAMGKPATLLGVNSPPSVPMYIRPGSLVAFQGSSNRVDFSTKWIQPLQSFLLGAHLCRFFKLVSTEPYSVLLKASNKNLLGLRSIDRSFATIKLDGTQDWSVLQRQALQAFCGSSLAVSRLPLPRLVSNRLTKLFHLKKREFVGLRLPTRYGYTFVSGRGSVALSANGLLYSLNVGEDEAVLIDKKTIVGISVSGPHDLQNCVVKASPLFTTETPQLSVGMKPANIHSIQDLLKYTTYIFKVGANFIIRGWMGVKEFLDGGNGFVKVIGPRKLILLSSVENHLDFSGKDETPKKLRETPADYLNEVWIEPGKPHRITSVDRLR